MTYEWKVGQEVILWWSSAPSLQKIVRTTPSGLAVIDRPEFDKDLFAKDGFMRGKKFHRGYIRPATDSERASMAEYFADIEDKAKRRYLAHSVGWFILPYSVIEAVTKLVRGDK